MNTERTQELLYMFNHIAPIARYLGMRLSFDEEGQALVDLPYNPDLDHALDGVHGGVYAILLDTAGWFTAAAAHDLPCWIATAEMSIHFLAPAQRTSLHAKGRMLRRGRRQHIVEMHLHDSQNRLVGHATGTFVILPDVPFQATGRASAPSAAAQQKGGT